jgi:short-subunit dehydrogenase
MAKLMGGTALVTGASSGIGAEFARQLARRGLDLVLVARRQDRLDALAQELSKKYPVRIETHSADLAQEDGVRLVEECIRGQENLTLLVNNAGFGAGGPFAEVDFQPQMDMLNVHILASVRLTRAALPGMLRRGAGGVIQVASVAGFLSSPGSTIYGSSKAFLVAFTDGLRPELHGSGVHVQALCPGFTVTEFHDHVDLVKMKRTEVPGFLWMSCENVVKDSLDGFERGKTIVVPGVYYKIAVALLQNRWIADLVRAAAVTRRPKKSTD